MSKLTKCVDCKQRTGGALRFTSRGWVHHRCEPVGGTRDVAKNLWDFESTHISSDPNSGPVKVQSLAHLRRLEKEHGVVSVLANYDRSDIPVRGGKEQFRDRRDSRG